MAIYALIRLRVILSFSSAATVATICAIVHVNIGLAYNCKRDTSKCPLLIWGIGGVPLIAVVAVGLDGWVEVFILVGCFLCITWMDFYITIRLITSGMARYRAKISQLLRFRARITA